jgi:hypothetical protein
MVEVLGITMRRLTYLVVAAIGMSAVNLVLRVWVIVPPISLEWEWFTVSVNSKNEATYYPSREWIDQNAIDRLDRENKRIKEELACLSIKERWC